MRNAWRGSCGRRAWGCLTSRTRRSSGWISTAWSTKTRTRRTVHPRTGGEHFWAMMRWVALGGSSPHGRGTPGRGHRRGPGRRFIPARAGNTGSAASSCRRFPVHPRTGGEHVSNSGTTGSSSGSSPHGRGTLRLGTCHLAFSWFIPARAGNTQGSAPCRLPWPVHPRTGGEHSSLTTTTWASSGSSPHGRGTLRIARRAPLAGRFIPARAGNTAARTVESRSMSVHPRTGGEHPPSSISANPSIGSSPHGRGTPRPWT